MKRSTTAGEVPTVPPVTATTLNQFTDTDVFVGEFFLNAADDLLWIRTDNGILPIDLSGSTGTTSVGTLTQVLYEGNVTNGFNIEVSSGDTIIYNGLVTGSSNNLLALDVSGRTIIVTGTTGGSGTSGTSGTNGSSGTSGESGTSGTNVLQVHQGPVVHQVQVELMVLIQMEQYMEDGNLHQVQQHMVTLVQEDL